MKTKQIKKNNQPNLQGSVVVEKICELNPNDNNEGFTFTVKGFKLKTDGYLDNKSLLKLQKYIDKIYKMGWSDCADLLMNKK